MLLRAIDDASRVWSSVGLRIALVKSRLLSCLSLHNARGAGTCAQCHLVFSFPEWETRLPSPEQSRVGLAFSLRQPALCSNFEHSRELALKFLLSGGTREFVPSAVHDIEDHREAQLARVRTALPRSQPNYGTHQVISTDGNEQFFGEHAFALDGQMVEANGPLQ